MSDRKVEALARAFLAIGDEEAREAALEIVFALADRYRAANVPDLVGIGVENVVPFPLHNFSGRIGIICREVCDDRGTITGHDENFADLLGRSGEISAD